MLIRLHSDRATTILNALREKEISFPFSLCGGNGKCGKCKVRFQDGTEHLACSTTFRGDLTIEIPDGREARICAESEGRANGGKEAPYGLALDIGTTTVVLDLVSLSSGTIVDVEAEINDQTRFGADVISRIQFTMERKDGTQILQKAITNQIDRMASALVGRCDVKREEVTRLVVSGNTTMLHFLLGRETKGIAIAPFTPAFLDSRSLSGGELFLTHFPTMEVTTLMGISSYVGSDITSGIFSTGFTGKREAALFLDLGTNGEMALWTGEKLFCCSAAAGPVFEGASIQCGTGSIEGAISHLDERGFETIGNKRPIGICGSGVIDTLSLLLREGEVDETGFMERDFSLNEYFHFTGKNIVFTPKDVREVQLAKSAVRSGIEVLLLKASLAKEEIRKVYLAGGFGTYLTSDSAIDIGLLSPSWKGRITAVGNASLRGAREALTDGEALQKMEAIRRSATYIELSGMKEFQALFIENMCFA